MKKVITAGLVALVSLAIIAQDVNAEDLLPPPPVPTETEPVIRPAWIYVCLIAAVGVVALVGVSCVAIKCKNKKGRTFEDDDDGETNSNNNAQSPLFLSAAAAGPDLYATGPVNSCACQPDGGSDLHAASASEEREEPQLTMTLNNGVDEHGKHWVTISKVKPIEFITVEQDTAELAARGWPAMGQTSTWVGTNRVSRDESPLRLYTGNVASLDGPGYEHYPRVMLKVQASPSLESGAYWSTVTTLVIPIGMKWRTVVPQGTPGGGQLFYRATAEPALW
jgi:hypothetical protein